MHSTASGDTSLREEIGLGGKFLKVSQNSHNIVLPVETQTLVQQLGNKQRKRRPRKDVLEVSQNSHSIASRDTDSYAAGGR